MAIRIVVAKVGPNEMNRDYNSLVRSEAPCGYTGRIRETGSVVRRTAVPDASKLKIRETPSIL